QTTVEAALTRLRDAGVDGATLERISSARFEVGTLPAGTLGLTLPGAGQVVISTDAARHGWFVDPTPLDDEEFAQSPWGALYAQPGTAAAGKMDLLTTGLHEMGHLAGKANVDATVSPDDLMGDVLGAGNRLTTALDRVFARGKF